ncbi:CGI-121-domain-containing protein [Mollisia scopiformis]|uniref:EKC/KEOPS complex subunit CGI121 n=1 Tax=Mollisia scopiformis TaxID=149040 RepID=A0A194XXL1_MOLSC|nr:CGI-121-domain-containing protein [Mollisia scopiformis]KUJ24562.1 CGI-121-domain-containing protein [Mollisia scopiformis]
MALLQTVQLEHLPQSHSIHIALYRNLQNAAFLQQQLLEGNTDYEYALIDASVIVSKIHALAAVYRAVNDLLANRLRSRNVHSEIVFSLSPNNNISESFRRFGIQPTTTSLLLIKVSTPTSETSPSDLSSRLSTQIQGDAVPFTDEEIGTMTDLGRVRKIYKLNVPGGGGKKKDGNTAEERREMEMLILGAMALRGATN